MILVVGGTGMLGTLLVRRLRARGLPVRVLTRDASRAAHLDADAASIAIGDLRDAASLRAALSGVHTVVAAAHGFGDDDSVSPASIDRAGNINLIDAAARAGAAVVLMSVVQAAADNPIELFRAKFDAERHLMASGAPWTIVRATAFVETWAGIMRGALRDTGRALVFGRGRNPINFTSVVDVAGLLERAVVDPSLRGEIIEIGGSTNLTFTELATLVGTALGTPANPRHIPRPALRALSVLARPFRPAFARHAGAAVVLDTRDMTWHDDALRLRFPDLVRTPVPTALERFFRSTER